MKYSSESLDLAIETILPYVKKAKDAGAPIESSRPELLKNVAVEYFFPTLPSTQDKTLCFAVARQAIRELGEKGVIEFGTKELSDEIHELHQEMSFGRPDALN